MSVDSEIARLKDAKVRIRQAIIDMDVDVPDYERVDTYAGYIDQIGQAPTPPPSIYERISQAADESNAEELFPVGTMIDAETGKIVTEDVPTHLTFRITGYSGVIIENGQQKQNRPQLQAVRVLGTTRAFGSANTTAQTEWRNCTLRTWLNNEYLSTLPQFLNSVIKTSVVSTCPYGSTTPYTTNDKIYIFSKTEVGGLVIGGVYKDGTQQAYYSGTPSDDSSEMKAKRIAYDSTGTVRAWWLRSAFQGGTYVYFSQTDGASNGTWAPMGSDYYVRPCFNL